MQHININQNIYLTQPFLLLPQQNTDANKLGGIVPSHQAASGQSMQGLFTQQSQEQQLAASNDRLVSAQSQQQQVLQNLMPPPSELPLKGQNGNGKHPRGQQQYAAQVQAPGSRLFVPGQPYLDQQLSAQIAEAAHQLSPASLQRVIFLKKVFALQQMSMRCLNVGAAASLHHVGRNPKGSMDPAGNPSLPAGAVSCEHLLQLEQEGKLDVDDIDFQKLKPIKYSYRPELFELPLNTQLKKQFQAFNRKRAKGAPSSFSLPPAQIKLDYRIFRVERANPQQRPRHLEPHAVNESAQMDGRTDKLTFSKYDYVCHAYEQNALPAEEAGQGPKEQQDFFLGRGGGSQAQPAPGMARTGAAAGNGMMNNSLLK